MVKMGEFSVGVVRRKIEQDEGKIRIRVSEKVMRMSTIIFLKINNMSKLVCKYIFMV